jgi:hypothetical protein
MKVSSFLLLLVLFYADTFSQKKASIVVLGVTHSAQLVNAQHQPAILRAFFNRVNPKAFCIESTPQQFLQSNFYEFTYEQQFCLLPYARKKNVPVYPFDWWPDHEDMRMALGITETEIPAFTRRANGFLGFQYFDDSSIINKDFYYAELESEKKK